MSKNRRFDPKSKIAKKHPDLLAMTFHDLVAEWYDEFVPFAHLDAHERFTASKKPFRSLGSEPTHYRQGLRYIAGMGLGWNKGRPIVCQPGQEGEPHFDTCETKVLKEHPNINWAYEDMVNLATAGNRVYYLSDAIVQRMVATQLDLPTELLRTPFPAFSMATNSETLIRMILGDKRQHEYAKNLSVNIVIAMVGDDHEDERTLCIRSRLMHGRQMGEVLSAQIHLEPGGRIRDALQAFIQAGNKMLDSKDAEAQKIRNTDLLHGWFGTSAEHLYRTYLNIIIYLSMAGAQLTSPETAAPRVQQSGPYTRLPVQYQEVGKSIAPLYIRPAEAFKSSRAARQGHRESLISRVLVAGHWRSWRGEKHLGESARVLHIEPYWKGPDNADAANRPYFAE